MTQTVYELAAELKVIAEKEKLNSEDIATLKRVADRIVWEHERREATSTLLLNVLEHNKPKQL